MRIIKYFRIKKVISILPGANCGSCGKSDCEAYARGIVLEKISIDLCPVCDEKMVNMISKVIKRRDTRC